MANQKTLAPVETARGASAIAATYSRVFDQECTSQAVYQHACRGLVHSSMAGYNSTIFAYGPTGSGKTFTMQSVMQQAAREIFDCIQAQPAREFLVRVSALEIYNEAVRDLLGAAGAMPLKVLEDPERGATAEGLAEEGVESVEHLEQLLQRVAERRQVGEGGSGGSCWSCCSLWRLHWRGGLPTGRRAGWLRLGRCPCCCRRVPRRATTTAAGRTRS